MRIACLLLLITCLGSCNSSRKAIDKPGWILSWSEEFNYTGLPDSTKWGYDVGGHGWGNNELQYYTQASLKNAEVSNGSLKIRVLHEKLDSNEYTSARLVTRNKDSFTYGRFEFSAKLPPGRGLWPAIWMLGTNVETVDWPDCGEIDIMEHVGYEKDSILGTIHTKAYNHTIGTQKTKKAFIDDPYTKYHLYSLEWTPERIDFFVDDKLYNHIQNEHKTTDEWPFDAPFYLILNIATGGNLGGKHGVDPNVFPATMEIDFIRVYKQANAEAK